MQSPARRSVDAFISRHGTPDRTLDIGCGPSRYRSVFPNRVGLDLRASPGVQLQGSVTQLPFGSGTFGVVLCTELLEHVPDPPAAICEIERVLVPGGKCLLTTRFCYPIHDQPHDFFRFTRYGLAHLFAGWDLDDLVEDTGLTGAIVSMVNARIAEARRPLRWALNTVWAPLSVGLGAMSTTTSRRSQSVAAGYLVVARKRKVSLH